MPYNNTPIAPPKDIQGQVSLPLARVQKIINADPERLHTSKNAAFAIALATEMFIQHLATTTHNVVKAERKPRRNIQYRDVATAVAKTDNLEFLTDVVPKTMTVKEYKKREEVKRKAKEVADQGKDKEGEASGSTTTAANGVLKNGDVRDAFKQPGKTNGHAKEVDIPAPVVAAPVDEPEAMDVDTPEIPEPSSNSNTNTNTKPQEDSEPEQDEATMQIEMEMRGPAPTSPEAKKTNDSPAKPSASISAPRRSSGFTAINGAK